MNVFLAIDAGGTKTDFVLANGNQELARVRSGTLKLMRTDPGTAAVELDNALAELTQLTGISMRSVTCTCIGTAGDRVPLVTNWLQQAFASRVSGEFLLLGDVEIALDAAFPSSDGVLVLVGTGSNIAGRDCRGNILNAGGWGPALADQASGYRIGAQALRALFVAIDEEVPTTLHEAALAQWSLPSLNALVEYANSIPAPDFSQFVQAVVRCAEAGDSVARSVLESEAEELGHLVKLVLRRLQASASGQPWTPRLAFTGSIVEHVPMVREAILRSVEREFPALDVREGIVDPVCGALRRAREHAGH